MKCGPVFVVLLLGFVWGLDGAPSTCYSRVLRLSKNIMDVVHSLHEHKLTKRCIVPLLPVHLDVHSSCIITKLRDMMYKLDNPVTMFCRERPRIAFLKDRTRMLYKIITSFCQRELNLDDCQAPGQSLLRYGEDRLKLLQER